MTADTLTQYLAHGHHVLAEPVISLMRSYLFDVTILQLLSDVNPYLRGALLVQGGWGQSGLPQGPVEQAAGLGLGRLAALHTERRTLSGRFLVCMGTSVVA
jgi:hypothetical protein